VPGARRRLPPEASSTRPAREHRAVEPEPDPAAAFRLDGRVALVTGASGGLGVRFARVLAAAGARLVICARRAEPLRALAADLDAEAVVADLATPAGREAVVGAVAERHGRLDVLVNNAGTYDEGPLESQSRPEIERVLTLNLLAPIDCCRLAAPLLFTAAADAPGGASVVNLASIYGVVASTGPMTAYNTSKGGLIAFTRQLAAQWGRRGVRVNALAPGYFPTEMTGFFDDDTLRRAIERRTLLRRLPEPHELDGALLFLASAASSYVTGQVLLVDGGWTVT
jgi:NAD(P)-dependent dehydrogenase (short-subunit alcohol dehydrogenase family)